MIRVFLFCGTASRDACKHREVPSDRDTHREAELHPHRALLKLYPPGGCGSFLFCSGKRAEALMRTACHGGHRFCSSWGITCVPQSEQERR